MSFSLSRVPKTAALTICSGLAVGTTGALLLVIEDRRRRINQARCALRNADKIRSAKQYHASDILWDDADAVAKRFDDISPAAHQETKESLHRDDEVDDCGLPISRAEHERVDQARDAPLRTPEKALTYFARRRARMSSYHDWGRKPGQTDNAQDQPNTFEPKPAEARPDDPKPDDPRPGGLQPVEAKPIAAKSVEFEPVEAKSVELGSVDLQRIDQIEAAEQMDNTGKIAADRVAPRTLFRPAILERKFHPNFQSVDAPKLPMKQRSDPGASRATSLARLLTDMNVDEIVKRINRAASLDDVAGLDGATALLRTTLQKLDPTTHYKSSLVQAAIQLCSKCQQAGLMEQAMRALYSAVELGPITETDYFAANPQPVVDYAVCIAESKIGNAKDKGWQISKGDRERLRTRMDRTIMLFTPDLVEGTWTSSRLAEWVTVVDRCVHLALDLGNMVSSAVKLYWRMREYGADFDGSICLRYMKHLHDLGHYRHVISTFYLHRRKLASLDPNTWSALGDIFTEAVDTRADSDPGKALRYLVEFCPPIDIPLRTTWMTKMLWNHWERANSFEKTYELFEEFEELGGFEKVVYKDGMYRTMIQIAVEAEQWDYLDGLLAKLLLIKPSAAKESRILGLLALAKARVGDWNAVWEHFKQMEIKDRMENVFAPVLHQFIKTHTTKETEDFLKAYVMDIEIPIGPHMVNMVANRYGDIRDYDSFLDWLSWCCQQGFEVDAAFGDAIIHNCRRRWECNFDQLQRIYRTLQALNPNFVSDVSERILTTSGLSAHKNAKIPFLKAKIGFATRKWHRWTTAESAPDLRLSMRHALATGDYRKVLFLYRTERNSSKRTLDEGHLRLAIRASVKQQRGLQASLQMIHEAKQRGIDTADAAAEIFVSYLRHIFQGNDEVDKEQLMRQVQDCIGAFEQKGLSIGHRGLLRVAHRMLKAKHYTAAIEFGMAALHSKGITHPDNIPTFHLFLTTYGYRADVAGLKWTLAGAVHTQYSHKRAVSLALKDVGNHLSKQIQSTNVKQAQRVVEKGLDMVRQQREEVNFARKKLETSAMDIMARAALEAKDQPTDEATLRTRDEVIAEIAEWTRLCEENKARKAEEYRVEMQARKKAAEEQARLNLEEADRMAAMLEAEKHELHGDF